MIKMRKITMCYDMKVFTDSGEYFGDVEEAVLSKTKIIGWRIRATKNSYLAKVLGSARGVIVPQNLVKSFGDVIIISRSAMPAPQPETTHED